MSRPDEPDEPQERELAARPDEPTRPDRAAATSGPTIEIRRATVADAAAIGDVYLGSFHATYDFPLAHTDEQVRDWLRRIAAGPDAWVAVEAGRVVGLLVVSGEELDQLYVAPDRLGEGIGRRLLDHAKTLAPEGLALYTFQVNGRARRFYERHGFAVAALGDGSGNEEGQPDVRYVWRPAAEAAGSATR